MTLTPSITSRSVRHLYKAGWPVGGVIASFRRLDPDVEMNKVTADSVSVAVSPILGMLQYCQCAAQVQITELF